MYCSDTALLFIGVSHYMKSNENPGPCNAEPTTMHLSNGTSAYMYCDIYPLLGNEN
jgi:hypothetical protein